MFNILVADSIENELNHLIFLLEDYKANHSEFDKILNIIDANSEDEAIRIVDKERIDILFISLEMDRVAFKAYKKSTETLIISVAEDFHRLRKWYIDHLRKPFCRDIFNLRLRSYLDILVNKKVGIKNYEKRTSYNLSLVSNLQLFWENHFTTVSNLNEIIHIIYSLGLAQIDKGVGSIIDVIERDHSITFRLTTTISDKLLSHLHNVERGVEFKRDGDTIEFFVPLDTEEALANERAGEFEDFALEYLSYDRLELLNDFLIQSEIVENEESIRELEERLYASDELQIEEIEAYINRKKSLGKKRYIFMDSTDLRVFGDIVDSLESLLINNSGERITIDEIGTVIDGISNIAQILTIYPPAKEIATLFNELEDTLLSNGKRVEDLGEKGLEKISQIIELLSDWRRSLLKREHLEEDLIEDRFIDTLRDVLNSLSR